MLQAIAHTTDFSPESVGAFEHALRLAVAARCRLDILHVRASEASDWQAFPHVRPVLARWGLLDAAATPADIEPRLGVHVSKVEIDAHDPRAGIARFLVGHRPDLLVVATHGREGVNRWLNGSIADDLAARTHVPTLLIGPHSHGFVDSGSGAMTLRRVLLAVADEPSPVHALHAIHALLSPLGVTSDNCAIATVGSDLPDVMAPAGGARSIERLDGPVAETIIDAARQRNIDLIAMPTAGHHGFLDAFRGSTTRHVVAHAPCPVLSLPVLHPR